MSGTLPDRLQQHQHQCCSISALAAELCPWSALTIGATAFALGKSSKSVSDADSVVRHVLSGILAWTEMDCHSPSLA